MRAWVPVAQMVHWMAVPMLEVKVLTGHKVQALAPAPEK
jgi:hypothetical protein